METKIQNQEFWPGDQGVRTGPTKIKGDEIYDTPFWGQGQIWNNDTGVDLFNDAERCKNKDLCNLQEAGKFSDDKEFHAYAFALFCSFSHPSWYEYFLHFTRMELLKGDDILVNRLWVYRIGAGGGVGGVNDNTTGFYHLNNGFPSSANVYRPALPWPFPPGKVWRLRFKMMQLTGTGVVQPVTNFNSDLTMEVKVTKLIRMMLWGIMYEDVTVA